MQAIVIWRDIADTQQSVFLDSEYSIALGDDYEVLEVRVLAQLNHGGVSAFQHRPITEPIYYTKPINLTASLSLCCDGVLCAIVLHQKTIYKNLI